jgi:hypothetical protein
MFVLLFEHIEKLLSKCQKLVNYSSKYIENHIFWAIPVVASRTHL